MPRKGKRGPQRKLGDPMPGSLRWDVFRNICTELGRLGKEDQDRVLGAIRSLITWGDSKEVNGGGQNPILGM